MTQAQAATELGMGMGIATIKRHWNKGTTEV